MYKERCRKVLSLCLVIGIIGMVLFLAGISRNSEKVEFLAIGMMFASMLIQMGLTAQGDDELFEEDDEREDKRRGRNKRV